MKRSLEPIDLVIAVGVFATVVGGYFMFMTSSGMVRASSGETSAMERTPTVADAMEWVQPALGQAMVDEFLLERNMARDLTRGVRELNRVSMADQRLRATPYGFVDRVRTYAAAVEGDHSARIQEVMGRTIVNGTARGVRTGALSPQDRDSNFNRALISQALLLGGQIDEAFRTGWQESLGRMIVVSSRDYMEISGDNQQRIGRSIIGVAEIQDAYRQRQEAVQVQLASAAVAAIHGEQVADRFAHLASADFSAKPVAASLMEPYSLPEVSPGVLAFACMALLGIVVAGMVMPMPRSATQMQENEYETTEERYRKTA